VATSILLLRHAKSTWNEAGRWQGWADPPLSPPGEQAARDAAGSPVLGAVEHVASSDLQRAVRTAELLRDGRGWAPVQRFRGLRERGAGPWTGLTRAEIEAGWPGALTPPVVVVGGEPPAAVTARAIATLHRIAGQWPGRGVLAVTHGGVIRLVEAYLGADPSPVPNLGGRWVHVERADVSLGEQVDAVAPAATAADPTAAETPLAEPAR
jgi:broad specificity phosphatase PhoE